MSWCCTDPSMAHPGGNKCANGVLAACSRAPAKGVLSVTFAVDSGKSARRGRAPGTLPRRVGHPSRRRLQDLRQARSHGEAHCVEAGLARQIIEEICKGQPPFRRETCGPTLLEAQRCRAQAACSRRASSLATSAARQRCTFEKYPSSGRAQAGAKTKPHYVRSKSVPVNSQGENVRLLWGPPGCGTQKGRMLAHHDVRGARPPDTCMVVEVCLNKRYASIQA
jgi:hypothetical protein